MSPYYKPGTIVDIVHISHSNIKTLPQGGYYYSSYTNEKNRLGEFKELDQDIMQNQG